MPNLILWIDDDRGREQVRLSGRAADAAGYPPQPTWDSLAARGVTFTRAYSMPACSMTRANGLTGRYGFHTGLGGLAEGTAQPLLLDELCLPQMLKQASEGAVRTAAFGKWHVSTFANGAAKHPCAVGFEQWSGSLRNLERGSEDYYSWNRWEHRQGWGRALVERNTTWTPTQMVDDALAWLATIGADEQFFLWLAPNAPHVPYQRPPEGLYDPELYPLATRDAPAGAGLSVNTPYFKAMQQASDSEFGRLLNALPNNLKGNTYVVAGADNGTSPGVVNAPYNSAMSKSTVYELGCNVPLVIAGPGVDLPGRKCSEMVHWVDLPRTFVELMGYSWSDVSGYRTPYDGVSAATLVSSRTATSQRANTYLEIFSPNGANLHAAAAGSRAIMDTQYKLVWRGSSTTFPQTSPASEFYDLAVDPLELSNLTPAGSTAGLTAPQLARWTALTVVAGTLLST